MNRDFKGVWISKDIWLNNELTWMEKLVLTELNSLDNEKGCFASNNYLAEFFNLSASRISQIISELKKKGFISCQYIRNGKEVKKRVVRILNRGIKNSKKGIEDTKGGYLESCEDSNTKNSNTKNSNTDNKVDDKEAKRKETHSLIVKRFYEGYPSLYNEPISLSGKDFKRIQTLSERSVKDYNGQHKEIVDKKIKILYEVAKENSPFKPWRFTPAELERRWQDLTDSLLKGPKGPEYQEL